MQDQLRADKDAFMDEFMTGFVTAGDDLEVTEAQRQEGVGLAAQSEEHTAVECIASWVTDFTGDLAKVSVSLLVIHGDSDGTVPLEVSGQRSHEAVTGSTLHVVEQGPHGINVSHADEFNRVLLGFLER